MRVNTMQVSTQLAFLDRSIDHYKIMQWPCMHGNHASHCKCAISPSFLLSSSLPSPSLYLPVQCAMWTNSSTENLEVLILWQCVYPVLLTALQLLGMLKCVTATLEQAGSVSYQGHLTHCRTAQVSNMVLCEHCHAESSGTIQNDS